MTAAFDHFENRDVRDLIDEYPLAWVSAADGDAAHVSLLPLLAECDADGRLTHLVGHMGRRNPLHAALSGSPRALILFRGPEGYISPEYAGTRDWAPTWNYAQISIEAEIVFEPERSGEALSLLVDAMEAARANPWQVIELGERYVAMERQIIGFRARVTRLNGKFKLGQDEQPETLNTILDHVSDPALARWMRRFNAERV